MSEWYDEEQLRQLGSCGKNVKIDKSVRIINPYNVFLGSNVRIDAWCFISAWHGVHIGNNVHIALGTSLFGGGGKITIEDFCGLSAKVSLFTATDDYTEGYLTNPTIPDMYKKIKSGKIIMEKHSIVGCGSVVMPNTTIKTGASVGALSFVNKRVIPEYAVVSGNPLRVVCKRDKEKLLDMERRFLENERA